MGKKHYLFAAAAPLALVSLAITPTDAAEIRKRTPKIGSTPQVNTSIPPEVGGNGRIRTIITTSEEDATAEERSRENGQPEDTGEEARSGPLKHIRSRIPAIKTGGTAEIENSPRIRSRTPATDSDEAVAVDSAEAAPSTPRTRDRTPRINLPSLPVDVDNGPRIRSRTPAPDETGEDEAVSVDSAESGSRARIRTPRIDVSTPAEVEDLPRIRKRVPAREADAVEENEESPRTRIRTPRQIESVIEGIEDAVPNKRKTVPRTEPRIEKQPAPYVDRRAEEPPARFKGVAKPDSVVLKGENEKEMLGGLKVVRTTDLSALTKNPRFDIGSTTFDFTPVLKNPRSLPNIAKQLQAMPDLVEVHPGKVTASQIPQGVVVSSTLSYSLKPGACTSEHNRARILATGVSCFSYRAASARESAVTKPGSVEFIEKIGDRSKAIATMREQAKVVGTDIDKHVAEFRAMLQNPSERSQLEASIGADEVQRMEQLDDTALAGELVNSHDVEIEEYGFIPIMKPIQPTGTWNPATIKAVLDTTSRRLAAADSQLAPATAPNSYPIAEYNFLTGFTISDNPEWRKRVSTTIRWCVVGCKKTYFAEAWAGFNYGLGMRFPMKFGGQYRFIPNGQPQLDATISMFNGDVDDYRSTGLPGDKLFNGQEIVAEFGAKAGVAAQLPLVGGIGPYEVAPQLKLTDYLPSPFEGGNVNPPMPNEAGPKGNFVLEQVDLLNNSANFGFISAKLHPSVEIALSSDSVGINVAGKKLGKKAETVTLPMDAGQVSTFKVANPSYNLGVTLTPGVTARMTLNLAVWSASVDWPVTLPAASIKTGADFGCHAGTICEREYILAPDGPYTSYRRDVKKWGLDFDKYWLPKCLDMICTTGVKLKRYDTVEWAWAQEDTLGKNADVMKPPVSPQLESADAAAQKYVNDSITRKAQKSSDTSAAMGILAQGIYTPQCQDTLCVDNVAALAAQMGPEAQRIATANPYQDASEINKKVNKEFGPKFVAEVEASKQRASMKQAASIKKQLDQTGGKQPKLPNRN